MSEVDDSDVFEPYDHDRCVVLSDRSVHVWVRGVKRIESPTGFDVVGAGIFERLFSVFVGVLWEAFLSRSKKWKVAVLVIRRTKFEGFKVRVTHREIVSDEDVMKSRIQQIARGVLDGSIDPENVST